jgi:predicted aconitase
MRLHLENKDQNMLEGRHGAAAQLAMSILVRMAEVYGAAEMMDITQVHIDGVGLLSEAGLEFSEKLVALGGKVVVPTTLNMVPLDALHWREQGVPEEIAAKARRQIAAYVKMGCIPTCTCAPYQGYLTPRFGQQIAWAESNAIVYANSVLGARTNRYGDYIDICAALTGRVPKYGLHLKANRKGQILFQLQDVDPAILRQDALYPVLGYLVGKASEDKIPVIEGLPPDATTDQLKALGAASASSGAVALFHAVGVTPEAPTLDEALQGGSPEKVIEVRVADLIEAQAALSMAEDGAKLDAVLLGCPHSSFLELQKLAQLVEGQRGRTVHPRVGFFVLTEQLSHSLAERADLLDTLTRFGVSIVLDTCPFHSPFLPADTQVIMTNSGKHAYYAPGELGVKVAFGSMADCVRSAVKGSVVREDVRWTDVRKVGAP